MAIPLRLHETSDEEFFRERRKAEDEHSCQLTEELTSDPFGTLTSPVFYRLISKAVQDMQAGESLGTVRRDLQAQCSSPIVVDYILKAAKQAYAALEESIDSAWQRRFKKQPAKKKS